MGNKPLISIQRTDLKETARQLKRIADCLETYLLLQFDYHMTPQQPLKEKDLHDKEGLSFHDDLTQSAHEVEDLLKGRPVGNLSEEDDV